MGFGPGDVVDSVGGVEEGEFSDGGGRWRGGEVEDVETAIAEDAEVLGGGNRQAVFVEGAKFDGVAVERGFEHRHGVDTGVDWMLYVANWLYHLSPYKIMSPTPVQTLPA